jgi:pimeloyl-ACP methyl ester carboxylesterase
MGGGGWWWIYPEVIEKTEHGWTDSGTEEFVMDLVEAAKRTGKVDLNRIYVTGHSMGGFGTWTLGAHHADVFAGGAAYAGAPSPIWKKGTTDVVEAIDDGVLPNWFALRLHVYQSLDDKNVPPMANVFATKALADLKAKFGGGWDFRYDQVDGRGHAAPQEGYLPSLQWVTEVARDPRPKRFLWQPVLGWKRHFYWLYWDAAEASALVEAKALDGNVLDLTVHQGTPDLSGMSVLVGPPLVDLSKEVVVRVNGEEKFRGLVPRTLSTLLLTLPRNDPHLLFDARVDL